MFNIIRVSSILGLEKEAFDLASKEDLTIYDASYLYVAVKNKFILVTDDQKLKSKAEKYVRVVTSSELASQYET